MNIIQTQKRLRFTRIEEYLSGQEEIVAPIAAFQEDFDVYQQTLAELSSLARDQVVDSKGQTAAKKKVRREMAVLVLELSSLVRLHAEKKGDLVLATGVKTTLTELFYLRGSDSLTKAEHVIEAARKAQPAMAKDYKLSSEKVDEAAAAVEAFRVMLNAPALAIDHLSVTTRAIEEAIARLSQVLSQRITVHVNALRRAHPAFAASYDQINTLEKRRGGQQKAAPVDLDETPASKVERVAEPVPEARVERVAEPVFEARVERVAEPVFEAHAGALVGGRTPVGARTVSADSTNGSRNGNGHLADSVELVR